MPPDKLKEPESNWQFSGKGCGWFIVECFIVGPILGALLFAFIPGRVLVWLFVALFVGVILWFLVGAPVRATRLARKEAKEGRAGDDKVPPC